MLNIDGRVDIDPPVQEFFDIQIALGMAAARSIGMSEFVNQCELGMTRDQRINIHFFYQLIAIGNDAARNNLKSI